MRGSRAVLSTTRSAGCRTLSEQAFGGLQSVLMVLPWCQQDVYTTNQHFYIQHHSMCTATVTYVLEDRGKRGVLVPKPSRE